MAEVLPFSECNATGPGWTASFEPAGPHPQFRVAGERTTARLFWCDTRWLLIGGDTPQESAAWTGPDNGMVDAHAWRWVTTNALQILETAERLEALEAKLRRAVGSSALSGHDLVTALQEAWDHSPKIADLLGKHEERVSGFVLREEAMRLRERALEQREEHVRLSWQALDAALLFNVNEVIETLERRLAVPGVDAVEVGDIQRRLQVLRDAQRRQARAHG